MSCTPADETLMQRALFHAARGRGRTAPNPMVGAVVVSADGVVVGHGWHERAGEAHAEVHALEEAGSRAAGGTLYVTLEPCCHIGRTGPCTERIIAAGIARVVAAMGDPDVRVAGRGFARLRERGVRVDAGLFEVAARDLNAAFVMTRSSSRPLIICKAATSLDGFVARENSALTRISGERANAKSHVLRASIDAIAVGSGTVLADDPLLTARVAARVRPLVRVIFDRRARTPTTARVWSTLDQGPVLVVVDRAVAPPVQVQSLERRGAVVLAAAPLGRVVSKLLDFEVATMLVEGGPTLQAAFCRAGLVDRFLWIVSPRTLGSGVAAVSVDDLPTSVVVPRLVEMCGDDTWIESDVHWHH